MLNIHSIEITFVASPAGPSFLPVVAPFKKKRIGVAYHQKKLHGSGRPSTNSHTQNSVKIHLQKLKFPRTEF
ncbi:MAG: hypothetical protein CFE21_23330 [Bacteroidetes bacterium B1(2017)]|nr:MAG: hypothetical protein CFE21_23330 [Bacteroidetes bacterium B1(2017)]